MDHKMNNHYPIVKKKPRQCMTYTCKIWSMVAVCVFLVIAASALMYFLLVKSPNKEHSVGHLVLAKGNDWRPKCPAQYVKLVDRFDCYPENSKVSRPTCESRGCCYLGTATKEDSDGTEVTRCVYPENYGYILKEEPTLTDNGFELSLQRSSAPSRFGDDIPVVKVLIEKQTPYRLRIKFYDAVSDRYEVPTPEIPVLHGEASDAKEAYLYDVQYNSSQVPFVLSVQRLDTQATIFNTSAGGLTLSHHFLELSTFLPSLNVYGLGRHAHQDFYQHSEGSSTRTLFSRPYQESGVHPMYMCVEDGGSAHGVLLLNSNAMEVKLSSAPAVTFRTLGGVLDFYLFLGPTPEDVVRQYNEAVGQPPLPPYWALGMHGGSYGFHSVSDVSKYVEHIHSTDITMEVIHLGVDVLGLYSARSPELPVLSNLTREVHKRSKKVVIPVQPTIKVDDSLNSLFKIGMKHNAFISDKWSLPFFGEVSGEKVAYADYGKSSFQKWWTDVLQKIFSSYLEFDGISLVNNQPLSETDGGINGCMNDDLNRPPYVPRGQVLYSQTICMDATQHWKDKEYPHYYLHNLYGHTMSTSTFKAMKMLPGQQRKLLTSQSTFVGSGHFVGHWIEGLTGSWELFEPAIQLALDYNIYGMPLVGVKLCICDGDGELLLRWIQLSLLFPMSGLFQCKSESICSTNKMNSDFVHSVQPSIRERYKLLPYLYTLFYSSHTEGSTVMRSVVHEFPTDNRTYGINSQFMWGSALMVAPLIKQDARKIQYFLPSGIWYRLYSGDMIISKSEWFNETLGSFDSHNPAALFLRAGHIIAVQQPSDTTAESQQNSMELLVALNSTLEAKGMLFWDDGFSKDSVAQGKYILVQFEATNSTLVVDVSTGSKGSNFNSAYIHQVHIMGLSDHPKDVLIGDYIVISKQKHWNPDTKVLNVKNIVIPLEGKTVLKWL